MAHGFDHFDHRHDENFASAVLCLLVDLDPQARERLAQLVSDSVGEDLGPILAVRREGRLGPDRGRARQRSDLGLRFGRGIVLVEVKTRTSWQVGHVVEQVKAQARSSGPVTWGRLPLAAVLLAPTALVVRVRETSALPTLRWYDLIECFRDLQGILAKAAIKHWESHVETTIGFDLPFDATDLDGAVRRVAALRALLEACAQDVGEKPDRRKLNLSGHDGRPFRYEEWTWHGISVPLVGGRHWRIGIYRYLEVPQGSEDALQGAWLELYYEDQSEPEVCLAFAPPRLDPASLDRVRRDFREECQRRGVAGRPLEAAVQAEGEE